MKCIPWRLGAAVGISMILLGAYAKATSVTERTAFRIGTAGGCEVFRLNDAKNDVYVVMGDTLHPCSITTVHHAD